MTIHASCLTYLMIGSQFVVGQSASYSQTTTPARSPRLSQASSSANSTVMDLALQENLQAFDPNILDLKWLDHRWILSAGRVVLKDFGRKEMEGRQALRLIRELRLNQHGTVGTPNPLMEYWLSDGAAPHGHPFGCQIVSFDPGTLRVEEAQGQWCVRDTRRVLFNFCTHGGDAQQARAVLKKYNFGQVAFIGQMQSSVQVFLAARDNQESHPISRQAMVSHDSPEMAARKAEELRRLQARFPGIGVHTMVQPAVRPLRTPDRPRIGFTSNVHELEIPGRKAMASPFAETGLRVPFDWRHVQTRREGNGWILAAGSLVLANFGSDGEAARQGLDAVRHYRFTERIYVDPNGASFSYFLCAGQAPRGVLLGLRTVHFQPEAMTVRPADSGWALCDDQRRIVEIDAGESAARELLAVIKRQQFDCLCKIGAADVMTFFVRSR
ncbi:MAG: hypothetical protein ACRD36_01475 [Candidatus Acidiferrum sp.]